MPEASRELSAFLTPARRSIYGLLVGLLSALPLAAQVPAGRVAPARLAPGVLLGAAAPATQTVRVRVAEPAAFRQWLRQHLPAAPVSQPGATGHILEVARLDAAALDQLAACPWVEFVDVAGRPMHDERLLNGADLTVNNIRAVQRRYPALRGQGLTVSIKENPLDPLDLDFRGRLLNTPPGTVIESAHASIMGTLIAGSGSSGPGGEGTAPQARIASASYNSLLPDANASLTALGVSVQNHSYGRGIENYYGLEAQAYDQQTAALPTLVHVFSAGNQGTATSPSGAYRLLPAVANITGQFKMSKNSLVVGAADALGQAAALSSRGPAYDGRVKPELLAYGEAGSSDAAALVSGAALLVQQAYRDQAGAGITLPPAALVKAALCNSADDVGRPQVDFVSGYGQLDALGAVRTVLEGRFRTGAVAQSQEQLINLTVPAGSLQLKVTLAWTDAEASANAPQALINDLDLDVLGPGSTRWLPWSLSSFPHLDSLARPARRRPDHLNNVEQVTIDLPAPGTYQLRVRGYAIGSGSQGFSVAYEVAAPGLEWLVPAKVRNVRPAQSNLLRWNWPGVATSGRLEYRPVGPGAAWRTLAPAIDLSQRIYSWDAPDTTTLAQLRFVVGSQVYESDTFALARPLPVRIGYVCADETLLSWPATPGATQYQLYRLGPTAPEPWRLVADTLLVLPASQAAGLYFAVAPVLGRRTAERGATANIAEAGLSCYVRSFLALPPIADTARLSLELGSLYHLQTIQLQRLGPGGFQTIQTLNPLTQLSTIFTDLGAIPGLNQYRILGQDVAGRSFTSEVVDVQLVRRNELLVFPIPVTVGQPLQVAGEPGATLEISLYDTLGRLRRTATADGAINFFDTAGLNPGVYLLRARPLSGSGAARTRRVVLE